MSDDPFHRAAKARAALSNIVSALDGQQDRLSAKNPMFAVACALPVFRHYDVPARVVTGAMQHSFAKGRWFAYVWIDTPRVTRDSVAFPAVNQEVWRTDLASFGLGIKSYQVLGRVTDLRPTATEAVYRTIVDDAQAAELKFAKGTTPWRELHDGIAAGVEAWVDAHMDRKSNDYRFLSHIRKQYAE